MGTDNYPAETQFTLQDGNDQVMMNLGSTGVTLSANTEYSFDPVCLPPQSYTFIITDSYGDGICCGYGQGFYKYTVDLTSISHGGGDFGANEETEFIVNSAPTQPPVSPTQSPSVSPTSSTTGPCDFPFAMTVEVDNVGGQTSYELIQDNDTLVFSNSNLSGGTTAQEEVCLDQGHKYTYKITDPDGICCSSGSGSYLLTLNDKLLMKGGEFEEYEQVIFRV